VLSPYILHYAGLFSRAAPRKHSASSQSACSRVSGTRVRVKTAQLTAAPTAVETGKKPVAVAADVPATESETFSWTQVSCVGTGFVHSCHLPLAPCSKWDQGYCRELQAIALWRSARQKSRWWPSVMRQAVPVLSCRQLHPQLAAQLAPPHLLQQQTSVA
jgi:hypothetical protein